VWFTGVSAGWSGSRCAIVSGGRDSGGLREKLLVVGLKVAELECGCACPDPVQKLALDAPTKASFDL
jgi:hypothetical protein